MPKSSSIREGGPLWELAVILPSQFVDPHGPNFPEALLMAAVLEDAFLCVRRNVGARDRRRCRELHEANNWFFSECRDWPFAFLPVCDTLGLDVAAVRQRVAALIAEHCAAETLPSVASPIVQHTQRVSHTTGRSAIAYTAKRWPRRYAAQCSTTGKPESAAGNS